MSSTRRARRTAARSGAVSHGHRRRASCRGAPTRSKPTPRRKVRLVSARVRRPSRQVDEAWQPRLYALLIGLLLILAYVVAFVVKNDDEVALDFVLFSTKTTLIWLILLNLALGILVGVLLSQLYRRRRGNRARESGNPVGQLPR